MVPGKDGSIDFRAPFFIVDFESKHACDLFSARISLLIAWRFYFSLVSLICSCISIRRAENDFVWWRRT